MTSVTLFKTFIAVDDKRSKKAAEDWINYVGNKRTRKQQLKQSLQRKHS